MSNNIQKQYDRLDDISSIMLRMGDVYAVPNRHIRYAATKAFFGTKLTEGSFLQSHGVMMLFLVEKFKDLKARLDNDAYIDVILQSASLSYDPFVVNYNMNGLEKSVHELINIYWFNTRCGVHICNDLQVLQRSKRLIKDEMILRLGDGKAIAAEVIVSIELAISHYGNMTKKLFVGQSTLANDLLDLIHTDAYGSLNTQARGGYSYFITFTDDYSRYGYVYLVRYRFETFRRFKEYRLKVENQTGQKIKALRLDRCGEYLIGEFMDYLKRMKFSLSGLLLEHHN
ncbi:hypothetical protein Sango_1242200 [Sesamum angolense]|uniref:Integrase catalytic domain-containing protein n=1 Tax=Sesamum angolense TaxID=2727404 RepID=A0AAE2BTY6_9LAMI|nr:hypothetical protein Sango_1242200 [Sesamum angolense]